MIIRTNSIYPFILSVTALITLAIAPCAIAKMVSVKGDNVNLRSGPGTNYKVHWEYGDGFPLRVLNENNDWIHVQDFENDKGWIHKSLLVYKPQVIVKVNRNKDKKINIRSGPGTDQTIVGKAYYGVVFDTLGKKSGWIKVRHETGLTGWIKETLLWGY